MPKRASIEFVHSSKLESTALRFGGEPYGFPASLWPKSKLNRDAMQFICQIPIAPDLFPGTADAVAYLFMSLGADTETWTPDGGENALIIVPRQNLTRSLTIGDAPRLSQMVKKWWSKKLVSRPCTFCAKLTFSEDPVFIPETMQMDMGEHEAKAYWDKLAGNKLGGTPGFLQGDELPIKEPWHLLLQLDSAQAPFWINFGDVGIGYAFINAAGTEGKFLWQCC